MHTLFAKDKIKYTGEQLHPHWAYKKFGLKGDSIVAFIGPCDIEPQFMLDLEDLKQGARIYSPKMLHFIVEHFDADMEKAILKQHILASLVKEEIEKISKRKIIRTGNDLYSGGRKLSISIATASPASSLIHFGINITTEGVPVPASGLSSLKISPYHLAKTVLTRYAAEIDSIADARARTRICRY